MSRTALLITASLALAACQSTPKPAQDDYADKMAHEHQHDTPTPTPASLAEPEQPVVTSEVVYATVEGVPYTGYMARPAEGAEDAPTLIVIHEWWGLNDEVKSMTRQLAGLGYVALAVDLYGAPAAQDPDQAKAMMSAAMATPPKLMENLRQGSVFLKSQSESSRQGVIGWCFGGAWALQTAIQLPTQIDAAVIYYGRLETEPAALEPIQAPLLGIFGSEDKGIPLESVRAFQASLKQLGKTNTIKVYEGADHAFANPSGTRYDARAATDAWALTRAFLAQHLAEDADLDTTEE